jgi:hypothetical protein
MPHILQYDSRPAKQVERRMMLDAFQILLSVGFPIRDYKYLGMGSVFFWDYLLFHKLLGLKSLTSVEIDDSITRRVAFNRPFRTISVRMTPIGTVLEQLETGDDHLVWMDYDDKLSGSMLEDAAQAGTRLGRGSICFITVDVEPPSLDLEAGQELRAAWMEYFRGVAKGHWEPAWTAENFERGMIADRTTELLRRAIESGIRGQAKSFLPLCHFLYRDGDNQMMTIGGMFGGRREMNRIQSSELTSAVYYRSDFENPYRIRVPRFTRRERYLLDRMMPRNTGWQPKEFEAKEEDLVSYSEIYRFLPAYAELLL